MSEMPAELVAPDQQDDGDAPSEQEVLVNGWRFEQFSALGFDLAQVAALVYSGVDLNVARRLIGSGCHPAIAAKILL
jgi:hypothetical protein